MFDILLCVIPLLSWITNGILIFLILRNSPQSMGNYKYLMLIFSIFGGLFGVINVTNQPKLHFYKAAYIIFSGNPIGLPRKVSFWYLALNCSTYGMTLYLLAFHFVYRYLAVCKPHRLMWFSYPKYNVLIFLFLFVTFDWWLTAIFFAGEDPDVSEYIRDTMQITFDLRPSDYTYAASLFYVSAYENQTLYSMMFFQRTLLQGDKEYASIPDFLFVLNLVVIIASGFTIITFCWFKLQKVFLKTTVQFRRAQSRITLEMQQQLFHALVAQTIFPVFLLFFPAGILLSFPIFKFEPGPVEAVILPLMATQPVIDSVVPMYFIKNYRKAIRKVFLKVSPPETSTRSAANARVCPI